MDLARRFIPNPSIVFREEDEGAFLFDPDTGDLKYLNRTGSETYSMLDGFKNLGCIIESLSGIYPDIDPKRMQKDIEGFLEQLQLIGYIYPADER